MTWRRRHNSLVKLRTTQNNLQKWKKEGKKIVPFVSWRYWSQRCHQADHSGRADLPSAFDSSVRLVFHGRARVFHLAKTLVTSRTRAPLFIFFLLSRMSPSDKSQTTTVLRVLTEFRRIFFICFRLLAYVIVLKMWNPGLYLRKGNAMFQKERTVVNPSSTSAITRGP